MISAGFYLIFLHKPEFRLMLSLQGINIGLSTCPLPLKKNDLHPAFVQFAPLIDIALDKNKPLFVPSVVLKKVEQRKALHYQIE